MKISLATAAIWKNRISHAVVSIGPRPARACVYQEFFWLPIRAKVKSCRSEGLSVLHINRFSSSVESLSQIEGLGLDLVLIIADPLVQY